MPELGNLQPNRYEREVSPSYYDLVRDGKVNVYHFECIEHPIPETFGANPDNVGNLLRNIKINDSLVLKVYPERIQKLGVKGVEYEGELEKVVRWIDRRANTIYLHFK